ncbi:MAG: peptide chain release factor N(5)-glutamine methyltransferase, partial [Clostridia bacterium]|nr:peptide chain release factor N(5)-glutamine methyltransferase [Clostridia bacterium]
SVVGLTFDAVWKPILNLLISLVCFSVCYELLLLLEKSNKKWLKKLCIVTSFLITEKPTKTEVYISMSAYNEVVFMCDKKRGIVNSEQFAEDEISFSSVYAESKEKLKNAGIVDASEIDWLVCEVLGIKRGQIRLQTKITQEHRKQIENAVNKRIKGEPITKIFGRAEFYGYEFKVTKDVLSPRMDTEVLVENALKYAKDKMNILDMCTGSGIIAISMAKNVNANFTAVDISEKALAVAQENAEKNNVKITFKLSNLFENLKKTKKFDIIISNPPYIQTQDIEKLDTEVKDYDPKIALDGGEDGLDFYKKIINQSPDYLTKNGYLMLEIGVGQKQSVEALLKENFEDIRTIKDYNKINRVIIAKLKDKKGSKNVRTNNKN